MKKYTIDEVICIFDNAGKRIYDATLSGDYKTNNKEMKRCIKIFKYFETDKEFAYQCLDGLFDNSNVAVRINAAAYSLALYYRTDYAESVLKEIAEKNDLGIFSFNAEMTLKQWKKNGKIIVYQK